jgi:hypothetical protein
MRSIRTLLIAMVLALGAGAATTGCATHTTTTTHTVAPDDSTGVEHETTTTTETHEPGGILSGTVDAIGWVLALPFRLVGGLISIIF